MSRGEASPRHRGRAAARSLPELEQLPDLPAEFIYFDEFRGEQRKLAPASTDTWSLVDGDTYTLDFTMFDADLRELLKHWALWALSNATPRTVGLFHWGNRKVFHTLGAEVFLGWLRLHPMRIRAEWHSKILPGFSQAAVVGLKSLLHFYCERSLGHLRPNHADFIGSFRLPTRDKYAAVRSGTVFLSMHEESQLVDYFDDLNAKIRAGTEGVQADDLRAGSVLLTSYQHAFRPLQIAKLRRQDVHVYPAEADGPVIHAAFETVKQRWSTPPRALARSFKREWSFMLAAFIQYRDAHPVEFRGNGCSIANDSFFGLSRKSISHLIREKTEGILGRTRSANELRHTAAQRMADAGATKEELAEFLGHSSLETGLIYFDQSPTQAARLNKALALSPIYSAIVEVARTGSIDKAALLGLPADRQVMGCPHGIPIAGIGACELGQSLCAKNPVLSCYGCRKFLPVADAAVHRCVLESLRPVVRFFFDASREEAQMPAYGQLTRTLAAVEEVIKSVEADPSR